MKGPISIMAAAISLTLIASTLFAKEARYPEFGNGRIEQNLVNSKQYMVSSANPYASEAGMRMLAKGGSAIDAAIAVQMVLNLVEPESSGIGGGAFALYWDKANKSLQSFDGREKAPMAADGKLFQQDGENMNWWEALAGGRAVGVPGVVAMMEKVHQQHGKLPWSELFEDAIKLSEEGFEVSPKLGASIAKGTNPALGRYEASWNYFFPDGKPLQAGVMKKNPELAMTFKRIALLGSNGFYKGQIALDIVNAARNTAADNPGLITIDDMVAYKAIERPPVCASYKTFKICGMGPPTSGGMTVIQILKLLEDKNLSQYEPLSPEAVHLFTQAGKLAYADREKYMADADFVDVPVEGLIDADYLSERAKLIGIEDMGKASPGIPPNANANWLVSKSPEQPSTTHFSIVDKEGNGFSMTSSIEMAFGSTVMVHGFLLNNQLTDFSFSEEKNGVLVANRVQPGKRPRSSMSPFMVFDENDNLSMVIGSPGGSRIINYVAKTMLGVLEWGMDIQSAISLPHFVNRNGGTDLEKNTDAASLKEALEALGHNVSVRDLNSGLHGITINTEGLQGAADPRRVGRAIGQ